MTKNIFFAADYHFGHEAPYNKFTKADGSFLRGEFKNADEGDEAMIERHNKVVKPNDRVYVVGDVAFHKRQLHKLDRMNGKKVLVKGNHDLEEASVYLGHFDDIRGSHQFDGILITHIPVHPDSLARWGFNVHGHLHANRVMRHREEINDVFATYYVREVDPRYFCVSVEQINYTPISLEEVKKFKPE
jgi:calcineurin-like phosphoesterase family protein